MFPKGAYHIFCNHRKSLIERNKTASPIQRPKVYSKNSIHHTNSKLNQFKTFQEYLISLTQPLKELHQVQFKGNRKIPKRHSSNREYSNRKIKSETIIAPFLPYFKCQLSKQEPKMAQQPSFSVSAHRFRVKKSIVQGNKYQTPRIS